MATKSKRVKRQISHVKAPTRSKSSKRHVMSADDKLSARKYARTRKSKLSKSDKKFDTTRAKVNKARRNTTKPVISVRKESGINPQTQHEFLGKLIGKFIKKGAKTAVKTAVKPVQKSGVDKYYKDRMSKIAKPKSHIVKPSKALKYGTQRPSLRPAFARMTQHIEDTAP